MYSRILVPIDGSPTSERGLSEAIALAAALKSQLVLLHVVEGYAFMMEMSSVIAYDESRRQLLKFGEHVLEKGRKLATTAGLDCDTMLREVTSQRAADAIVEAAADRQCALIAMGTHGRRGISRLAMGSDAELVLREAGVPVLLVRHR